MVAIVGVIRMTIKEMMEKNQREMAAGIERMQKDIVYIEYMKYDKFKPEIAKDRDLWVKTAQELEPLFKKGI